MMSNWMRLSCMTLLITLGTWVCATPIGAVSASQYRQLGLSYRQQGQYTEAIAALKKSVELEPNHLSGRVLLGWTLHRAGDSAQAADVLSQTLSLNPFDVPTLNALGIVRLVSGELVAAVTTHTWAAILKPDNEIAHYNLSLALERLQQYNWAIATAQTATKLEPSNPHPLIAQAVAYWGNADPSTARQRYRQALSLDGRYGDITFLNYLSEAGFSSNQIQTTREILQSLPQP